jgi:hypothetical protein
MTVRIYADFNDQDELGRVWLNTGASLQEIGRAQNRVHPGLPVVLYTDENDYVEVEAVLVYDDEHHVWLADWSSHQAVKNS